MFGAPFFVRMAWGKVRLRAVFLFFLNYVAVVLNALRVGGLQVNARRTLLAELYAETVVYAVVVHGKAQGGALLLVRAFLQILQGRLERQSVAAAVSQLIHASHVGKTHVDGVAAQTDEIVVVHLVRRIRGRAYVPYVNV